MHNSLPRIGLASISLALVWMFAGVAIAGDAQTISLPDGTDMSVVHYPAAGNNQTKTTVLWIPSEHGLPSGLGRVATALAKQGVDTWVADPYTTWFLPVAESSLAKFERKPLAELVATVHQQTGKKVVVVSSDRGSAVALEVIRQVQESGHADDLAGAVLISPNLYRQTPQPGQAAQFKPIATATNVPVVLMVPARSTLKLRMSAVVDELRQGGSPVYFQTLPNVRDRFFFRPDSVPAEDAEARRLPGLIRQAMTALSFASVPAKAAPLTTTETTEAKSKTQTLEPYTGSLTPPPFDRVDLDGKRHTLKEYHGQVVLLNFWASWCPPCVHEMPSMARLQKRFAGQPFQILAVNLGQSRAEVEKFLKSTPVNFPVFLDENEEEPKRWQVFAFPTSYLIDAKGQIRYGVAGGLEWDGKAAVATVAKLVAEAKAGSAR